MANLGSVTLTKSAQPFRVRERIRAEERENENAAFFVDEKSSRRFSEYPAGPHCTGSLYNIYRCQFISSKIFEPPLISRTPKAPTRPQSVLNLQATSAYTAFPQKTLSSLRPQNQAALSGDPSVRNFFTQLHCPCTAWAFTHALQAESRFAALTFKSWLPI